MLFVRRMDSFEDQTFFKTGSVAPTQNLASDFVDFSAALMPVELSNAHQTSSCTVATVHSRFADGANLSEQRRNSAPFRDNSHDECRHRATATPPILEKGENHE